MDILSCLSTPAKIALCGVAAVLATALAPAAIAAEIKVIASNDVREPYRELVPIFEKNTGHKVTIDWGVSVAVRAGASRPDISSAAALRSALLAAKSIVLSSGPSSVYLPTLFQKMGIADELKPKIIQIGPGLPVGETIARGEGEIGFTQMSELMSVKGIDYLGPLPAEVQFVTVFSAGLHAAAPAPDAARALLKFLTAPEAAPVLRSHGMEPGCDAGSNEDQPC